jgi:S-disulfanyl-L-cysteine oxidoreductase SoxD
MSMRSRMVKTTAVIVIIVGMIPSMVLAAGGSGYRGPFGLGHAPSASDIKARDIAVGPDGAGLPPGHGTVSAGEQVYQA